jgi:hypothetical protein
MQTRLQPRGSPFLQRPRLSLSCHVSLPAVHVLATASGCAGTQSTYAGDTLDGCILRQFHRA